MVPYLVEERVGELEGRGANDQRLRRAGVVGGVGDEAQVGLEIELDTNPSVIADIDPEALARRVVIVGVDAREPEEVLARRVRQRGAQAGLERVVVVFFRFPVQMHRASVVPGFEGNTALWYPMAWEVHKMRVFWTIAGTLALFVGALAVQGSRSHEESKTNPERETAELLDSLVQPRFQVTNGKDFGMGRIAPLIKGHGHMGLIEPESEAEKRILAQVTALGCEYRLGFVHTGYQLSRYTGKAVRTNTPDFETVWRDNADYNAHKNESLAPYKERILPMVGQLERGAKIDTQQAEWQVFLRPVKAEKATCASCHAGVKTGQVMGAMVYLVKKSPAENQARREPTSK